MAMLKKLLEKYPCASVVYEEGIEKRQLRRKRTYAVSDQSQHGLEAMLKQALIQEEREKTQRSNNVLADAVGSAYFRYTSPKTSEPTQAVNKLMSHLNQTYIEDQ